MIELKNVKSFLGMEGHGFNAGLYFNGQKVALVIDDASGGPIMYQWQGKTSEHRAANEKAVVQFVDALPPEALPADAADWERDLHSDGHRKLDLDDHVSRLVDAFENDKRLTRLRKTAVVFKTGTCKPGEMFTIKHKGDPERMKKAVLVRHPDAVFL